MTTVVVAVLVAVASGLGATLLSISHERGAELRTRMLNAADEFSIAVVSALQQMRNTAGEITRAPRRPLIDPQTELYTDAFQTELDKVNDAVAGMFEKLARVHLLFGDLSDTGRTATAIAAHLENMDMALNHRPDSIRNYDELARYQRNTRQAVVNHGDFNRAALRALRDTSPRRFGRWLRTTSRRLLGWLHIRRRNLGQ
jgi:hypothetical protein